MNAVARAWITAVRARQRARRMLGSAAAAAGAEPPRAELVRRLVPGRSFLDVGCMWSVDGAIAFAAEQAGARSVTGVDLMAPTAAFEAERARRGSAVRFVRGDIHDAGVVEEVGVHDVVWCSGVLYHAPNPLLTLARLRTLTTEQLVLATEVLPELPGLRGACVFYPGLDASGRRAFAGRRSGSERVALDTPFDAARGYENWWWGITPSALEGMLLASGFEALERVVSPFHATLVARPTR
ncbi:MAG: class I SAM-dependent methyltransferase [Solirubrobacteraceae bacterium]